MVSIKEMFDDIVVLAEILEDNAIDAFKFPKGIGSEKITDWENNNAIKLPQGYKEFIICANGFSYAGSIILPLEKIEKLDIPEEFSGYYMIGSYIGDGSLLMCDDKGGFYYGDHVNGVEKAEFTEFLSHWVLDQMKDSFKEYDLDMPENLNTKETEEDIRKREEKIKEMLRKLEEIKAKRQ